MKQIIIFTILAIFINQAFAETDSRVFTFEQTEKDSWSIYVVFDSSTSKNLSSKPHGDKIRNFQKITDNLYLQIYSQGHAQAKSGVYGYSFSLTTDADGKNYITTLNIPAHGYAPDVMTAAHFRNLDNTGPNELGPKNVNAEGATRIVEYEGYTMVIRALEAEIINLSKEEIPTFSHIRFHIMVTKHA